MTMDYDQAMVEVLQRYARVAFWEVESELEEIFVMLSPCDPEWARSIWRAPTDVCARLELLQAAAAPWAVDFDGRPAGTLCRSTRALDCLVRTVRAQEADRSQTNCRPTIGQIEEVIFRLDHLRKIFEGMKCGGVSRYAMEDWEFLALGPMRSQHLRQIAN